MSQLDKNKKKTIFKEYGNDPKNTGSIEAQVALLTARISALSEHLKVHKKDYSTQRGQAHLIGKRKKFLAYLQNKNLDSYRSLISKLGIRK